MVACQASNRQDNFLAHTVQNAQGRVEREHQIQPSCQPKGL